MKISTFQTENERKAYTAPLLKHLGEVKNLTKEEKGSATIDNPTTMERNFD